MISKIIGPELVAKFQDPLGIDYIINLVKTGTLSINATDTSYGNSLLHFAVSSISNPTDFYKFLAFYQENGGNFNAINGYQKTALDLCPRGDARERMHWKTQALLTFNTKPGPSLRPLLFSATLTNPIKQKIFTGNEAAKVPFRKQLVNLDERRQNMAINMFNQKKGLAECIETKVLPNLLYIQTRNGTYGTGFFQHNKWIVSNAHVLAFAELFNGAKFYTFSKNAIDIEVSRSFHRPAENPSAPDIVIVNAESSHNDLPSVPMQFSDDKGTPSIYFYIKRNSSSQANNMPKINFLEKLSHTEACPDIYQCLDSKPLPGESGSPIFAARVIMAREPSWQICVVGVLYARCSPEEYNNQAKVKIESAASDQILICAIPIAQDFEQILQNFLREEDIAIRAEKVATLIEKFDPKKAQQQNEEARAARAKMASGLSDFNMGMTNLNINLPAGLTKLLGKTIVPLGRSMLLGEKVANQWKKEGAIKKEISKLPHANKGFPNFSLKDLEADLEDLLSKVSKDEALEFSLATVNKTIFETRFFRIDQMGASNNNWKLELQDNTNAFYPKISPSLSCTFAVVLVPKGPTIQGSILAQAFRDSLQEQKSNAYLEPKILPKQRKAPVFLPAPSATSRLPNNCCASKRPLNLGEDWNDPDRRFQHLLEERFFQPIKPLSKNGHCQFKAIAHELQRLGEFSTVNINQLTENTRRIAIKCMEIPEKRNELILFFNQEECNGCPSYDEYLMQMKNSLNSSVDTVAYGSEITLNAVGNLLWKNKQIAIILMHPNDFFEGAGEAVPLAQRVYGCKDLTKLNLEKTIYLVFDGGNHYDAIEYLSEGLKTYWQGRLINAIANINPPTPAHHHGTALIG